MTKMAESFGSAMGNAAFPWQTPANFPVWAQMTMNPQFRQGMREMAKELVDDVVDSVREGIGGMFAPAMKESGLPSLKEIVAEQAVEPEIQEAEVIEVPPTTEPPAEEPVTTTAPLEEPKTEEPKTETNEKEDEAA